MRARKIINIGIAAMVAVCSCGGGKMSPAVAPSAIAPSSVVQGTFTDERDGKTYRTVKIGEQTWMAENLNYDTADGTGSWCYNNEPDNCVKYGRLYNWETAMVVCPQGWRLPSNDEWNTLVNVVGGKDIAGTKLKSRDGWYDGDSNYKPGTNDYGFSAMPSGWRYSNGKFSDDATTDHSGGWWTATEDDASNVLFRSISHNFEYVYLFDSDKHYTLSVRCILDD